MRLTMSDYPFAMVFIIFLLTPSTLYATELGDSLSSEVYTEFHFDKNTEQSITIKGSSTLHKWSCQTNQVKGRFVFYIPSQTLFPVLETLEEQIRTGDFSEFKEIIPDRPPYINISIPIKTFDCGRQAMNQDMYEALKADSEPNIGFMFYRIKAVDTAPPHPKRVGLKVIGGLSMARVGRTVELPVTIERTKKQSFRIKGSVPMKMTQFDVTPPTALFGLIKAHDEIKIKFDLTVVGPGLE